MKKSASNIKRELSDSTSFPAKEGPIDFDIYEAYVEYKITPTFPEILHGVLPENLAVQNKSELVSQVQKRLIRLCRASAMITSISLAQGVIRSMIGEDSDIVYADSYLAALQIALSLVADKPQVHDHLTEKLKAKYTQDIEYIILSPDREIHHIKAKAWDYFIKEMEKEDLRDRKVYLINVLGKISKERLGSNWKPYNNLKNAKELTAKEKELYEFHLSPLVSSDFPHIAHWNNALNEATNALEARGLRLWGDE